MGRKSRRKTRRHRPTADSRQAKAGAHQQGWESESWLAAAVCAMLVARPLYPSEAVAQGHGLPAVMLWLALLVLWLAVVLGRAPIAVRFGWLDAAVLLLVGLHTISGVWAAFTASARPAVNVLWEWIALGTCYLLARQLFAHPKQVRALVAVMIGTAVFLSAYGLYQYVYEFPLTRAAFQSDPEAALREAGMWLQPGSRQWQLYVQRLESTEPISTFALANSLAGFLVPWLLAALGVLLATLGSERAGRWRWAVCLGGVGAAAACGICLLLTKSRSAYLAVLLGIAGLWIFCRPARWHIGWKVPLVVGLVLLVLLSAALFLGGLDWEVLLEAPKSLAYRFQYWQATLQMIAERPLLGCGPGNFQYTYTAYMLPEASEEIADPHNFLLEVWATAGTPAAIALVAVIAGFFWTVFRHGRVCAGRTTADHPTAGSPPANAAAGGKPEGKPGKRPPQDEAPGQLANGPWKIYLGGAVGLLLAVPLALTVSVPPSRWVYAVGLVPAVLACGLLWPWVQQGKLPRLLPSVAVAALLLNLTAAGGIGFPGVAQSLWILVALGLNQVEQDRPRAVGRGTLTVLLGITLLGAAACYLSAYQPVLASRSMMERAGKSLHRAEQYLEAAARADKLSSEPAQALAQHYLQQYLVSKRPEDLERFRRWCRETLRRCPNSASLLAEAGRWYGQLFAATGDLALAQQAAELVGKAVSRYPSSAFLRAEHALALAAAGEPQAASSAAAEALRLDQQTPHADKKLAPELKAQMELLIRSADKQAATAL